MFGHWKLYPLQNISFFFSHFRLVYSYRVSFLLILSMSGWDYIMFRYALLRSQGQT